MWRVFARFSSDGLGWELGLRSSGSAPVGKSVQSDAIDGYSVRRGVSRRGVRRGHHGVQEIKMMPFRAGRPMYPG